MFGKLVSQNGEVIDLASIKFQSTNIFGFSVIIENFDITNEFNNFQIVWMLIGLPSEIGFYSLYTRNIPILALNSCQFTFIEHSYITLKVPENLPENSIMCTNFIYPISDYKTKFTASIQKYHDDEIKIEISVNHNNGIENEKHHEPVNHGYESDIDNDNESEIPKEIYNKESKYLIQWCIIILTEDQMNKTPFLNKIGKPIHTSKKIDISDCPSILTLDNHEEDIDSMLDPIDYDSVKVASFPEEDFDAMLTAIDNNSVKFPEIHDSVKYPEIHDSVEFPEIHQKIFETFYEILDIIENAGHNKFIGCTLLWRIYVVSQELKKSIKDIQNLNKHLELENLDHAIKSCKEFVHNISKSVPLMKLISAHKIETVYVEVTTKFDSAKK
ncbi:hypothetical protein C2G38_1358109 [Gigaspora rosea]|uniref:Uncharacterized protein n=1 Tax=Gigaspora rosea TaxID=44941 RepID=A0A397V6U8_9GLOM|nr:hypothetical protein C2G38_1358109 [Gigaspora rosea]